MKNSTLPKAVGSPKQDSIERFSEYKKIIQPWVLFKVIIKCPATPCWLASLYYKKLIGLLKLLLKNITYVSKLYSSIYKPQYACLIFIISVFKWIFFLVLFTFNKSYSKFKNLTHKKVNLMHKYHFDPIQSWKYH